MNDDEDDIPGWFWLLLTVACIPGAMLTAVLINWLH